MTTPVDVTTARTERPSRRALLAGALGGLGVWAASAVGRAKPVRAESEPMVVGGDYDTATTATTLTNQANNATVFLSQSLASGVGLWGYSASGIAIRATTPSGTGVDSSSTSGVGVRGISGSNIAVQGQSTSQMGVSGTSSSHIGVGGQSVDGHGLNGFSSNSIGLVAQSNSADQPAAFCRSIAGGTGLFGESGGSGILSAPLKTGVYGVVGSAADSQGVWGVAPEGRGVRGETTSGVGLLGIAASGFALQTAGRTKLSTSGVATIPAGSTGVTISPGVNVTGGSFVLLTPKANIGSRALWFTTNATADSFTIRMSSQRSSNTRVAWLLLG